jgi:hypothetical protein
MRGFERLKKIALLFILLVAVKYLHAQQPAAADTTAKKQINIMHADKISYKKVDSLNEYQILVGNVAIQQEKNIILLRQCFYKYQIKCAGSFWQSTY